MTDPMTNFREALSEMVLAAAQHAREPTFVQWKHFEALRNTVEALYAASLGYQNAVDHELIVGPQSCTDAYTDPRKALSDVIQWNIAVATDECVNGGFRLVPVASLAAQAEGAVKVPKGWEITAIKCDGCGRRSNEDCGRHPDKACMREFCDKQPRAAWAEPLDARPDPQAAKDAVDAARYRWLRDMSEPHVGKFYISVNEEHKDVKFAPESVDSEIDACIGILAALALREQGAEK